MEFGVKLCQIGSFLYEKKTQSETRSLCKHCGTHTLHKHGTHTRCKHYSTNTLHTWYAHALVVTKRQLLFHSDCAPKGNKTFRKPKKEKIGRQKQDKSLGGGERKMVSWMQSRTAEGQHVLVLGVGCRRAVGKAAVSQRKTARQRNPHSTSRCTPADNSTGKNHPKAEHI